LRGVTFLAPASDECVVMKVDGIHMVAGLAHHDLRPVVIAAGRAGGDAIRSDTSIRPQEGREVAVHVGVVLGTHVASAAPALIADAPHPHTPGLLPPVLAPPV